MAEAVRPKPSTTSARIVRHFIPGSLYSEEILDLPGAVHERIQMHPHPIEQREMEIGQVRSLLVADVPAALHTRDCAAGDENREAFVIVSTRIPDAASVQIKGVVEERAVAIRRGFHSLQKIREQRYMKHVDLGDRHQLLRIAAVVARRVMRV